MTTEMPQFTPNELVWYEKDGQIHSSGYKVESLFKTLGIAPMTTLNEPVMKGGNGTSLDIGNDNVENVSDLFRFMGVPAGLSTIIGNQIQDDRLSVMTGGKSKRDGIEQDIQRVERGVIPSSLYDKLAVLAGPDNEETIKSTEDVKRNSDAKKGKRKTRRKGVVSSRESSKHKTTRRKHRK